MYFHHLLKIQLQKHLSLALQQNQQIKNLCHRSPDNSNASENVFHLKSWWQQSCNKQLFWCYCNKQQTPLMLQTLLQQATTPSMLLQQVVASSMVLQQMLLQQVIAPSMLLCVLVMLIN